VNLQEQHFFKRNIFQNLKLHLLFLKRRHFNPKYTLNF